MKHLLKTLIVVCVFSLSACSFIARTVNHGKKPATQNPQSIRQWLQKEKINIDKIFTVEPSVFYNVFLKYGNGAKLFNENGDFVSVGYNADSRFCPKGVKEFLSTLTPGFEKHDEHLFNYLLWQTSLSSDTLYPTLKTVYSFSRDLEGKEVAVPISFGQHNYTLVISFSLFKGNTIQTAKIRDLVNSAAKNPSTKIDIILLNIDKQEWWGKEWNEKIHIKA